MARQLGGHEGVTAGARAYAISFFGAHRTLGNFTFAQAGRDMAENARNNPQAVDWTSSSSSTSIGISPYTGESGPSGSSDSQGNIIP